MSWLEMLGLFLSDSLPYGADVGTGFNMIPLFRTSLLIHTNTHTHTEYHQPSSMSTLLFADGEWNSRKMTKQQREDVQDRQDSR